MTVTMKKVARRAGVSISTVSRVLTGHSNVREETSRRVRQTIEELGYTPNIIAQNLVSRTTRSICVLLPGTAEKWSSNLFFMELIRGIVLGARRMGYDIQVGSGAGEQEELEVVSRLLKGGRADGAILLSGRKNSEVTGFLRQGGYPFVLVEDDRTAFGLSNNLVQADGAGRNRSQGQQLNFTSQAIDPAITGFTGSSPGTPLFDFLMDDSISRMGSMASQMLIESIQKPDKTPLREGRFINASHRMSISTIGV
ncbi:HTH-type transcriptional repressor PurR [Paenibacillus auburnensis]|uniref:HTH-type transcriptional repressor PurR n=1 Tax=Paenibacillus auburnensis TaxID=2905649 RepID=A0ABN8G5K5_9BACL|nr:LacI family DNA-binding transcriptional regulator [Paenibacillus auburnensis]CAH1194992.1 HTH-type transcriptional repressor PurR [Paenibacillus auburnensis]